MNDYKYMVCVRCITFNHAPYIEDALNGFTMQQTTFPFVCTIVDDASTDGEPDIIRRYVDEHFLEPYRVYDTEYAHIFCAKHKTNLNCEFVVFLLKYNHYSIQKSKLEYLSDWIKNAKYQALCEGDDYWINSHKLQRQVLFLEQNPDYVLSHTSYKAYFERTGVFVNSKDIKTNQNIKVATDVFRSYRIMTLTVVFRTDVYNEVRAADPYLFGTAFKMGDGQLWYEMARKGKIHFIPEVLCVYRVHEGSASRQPIKKAYRFALSCAEMQLYVTRRDCLSNIVYFEEKYKRALKEYLLFDPEHKAMFETDVIEAYKKTPKWKKSMSRLLLSSKFYIRKKIGWIQKYFIKSY